MPILHIQSSGVGQTPDGEPVEIPGQIALILRGPCVQVTLNVPSSIAEQLLQQGKPIPEPISGIGLIDTGASSTCVDADVATRLQLPVIDVATMSSASHAASQQNVYPVAIELVGTPIAINAPRVIGAALAAQGLMVLIGRDVLKDCTLFYNGLTGALTLSV